MANKGFNWKSIFIIDKENDTTEHINQEVNRENKFPDQNPQISSSSIGNNTFLDEIVKVYEKGFNSLNAPEFDFFEYYKSVMSVGVNNSQSYQMAYAMGSSLNSNLTKEFLLEKSAFYISEIEKVHKDFLTKGTNKSNEINSNINNQKESLKNSILDIEAKITQMQKDLIDKRSELEKIETGKNKEYVEIQQKLEANEFAKEQMLQSINQVVNGINQYLK